MIFLSTEEEFTRGEEDAAFVSQPSRKSPYSFLLPFFLPSLLFHLPR